MMQRYDRTWWWLRLVFSWPVRLLLRPRVSGAAHVPATGPLLLVANHESWWDIPLLGWAQPRTIRFMAKAELFRNRALGALMVSGGTFPVRRGEPDRDALRTVHETMLSGGVVGIFIQGHRQAELVGARAGAGRCAVVETVPVVPVAVRGTRGWRPGRRVAVAFGPARVYERGDRRPGDAYRETADELMAEIRRLYGERA